MAHKPAGGIKSRQVTQRPVRTGAPRQGVRPAGVAQIGAAIGNHTMRDGNIGYRGEKIFGGPAFQSKLGNEIAAATKCGPGGFRTVMRSGQQGTHGSVVQGRSKLRDTRGQWPDSKR